MFIDFNHFTARCYAECGYATTDYVVCLSVTFRYRDHIGWKISNIISQPNSLSTCSHWPRHGRSGATGTPRKL